jgi:hypothetical protein
MPAAPSIVGAVQAAFRFVAPAWAKAWAAMILTGGLMGGYRDAVNWGAAPVWKAAWCALALLAFIVAAGALYRSALERPGARPGGLQWGRVETRLLAVWLLTGVFLVILGLLVFVAVLCSAYAVASAGAGFVAAEPATWAPAVDGRGRLVVGAVGMAGATALVWAKLRLCLSSAATVARGRVQVLSAWPLTRGITAPILAAWVLVGVAPAVLTAGLYFLRWRLGGGPLLAAGAVNFALGMVIAGLWLPNIVGLMAYLYGRLEPDQPDPASAP